MTTQDYMIAVDPKNHWPNVSASRLLEVPGTLLPWAIETEEGESVRDSFERNYCCPVFEMQGEITDDGLFTYPGDPDLYPVVLLMTEKEDVFFYQYAIVAILNKDTGDTFITRMD